MAWVIIITATAIALGSIIGIIIALVIDGKEREAMWERLRDAGKLRVDREP